MGLLMNLITGSRPCSLCLAKMTEAVGKLTTDLSSALQIKKNMDKENSTLRSSLAEKEAEVERWKKEAEQNRREANRQEERCGESNAEVERLTLANRAMNDAIDGDVFGAEVIRLKAEVERLKTERANIVPVTEQMCLDESNDALEIMKLKAEVEFLKKENERLRGKLVDKTHR